MDPRSVKLFYRRGSEGTPSLDSVVWCNSVGFKKYLRKNFHYHRALETDDKLYNLLKSTQQCYYLHKF